jgi:hypothetical protein
MRNSPMVAARFLPTSKLSWLASGDRIRTPFSRPCCIVFSQPFNTSRSASMIGIRIRDRLNLGRRKTEVFLLKWRNCRV